MKLPWSARLCVSVLVLAVLLAFVPVGELWQAVRQMPANVWLTVLALFLLGHVAAAAKWRWLLTLQVRVPFRLALRAHFAGLTANLCLPGIAGGDVVRAVWIMRHAEQREAVAVAGLADRLIDTIVLLMLATMGIAGTGGGWATAGRRLDGALGVVLLGAAGFVLLAGLVLGLAYWRFRKHTPQGIRGRVAEALTALAARPSALFGVLGVSLAVQGSFVLLNAWLGRAAGVECPLFAWFLAWPLAKLVALVPVSLAGLGVREAALVVFLKPFGAAPAMVTAAGLLWQGVLAAGGVVGGVALAPLQNKPLPSKEKAAAA